MFRSDALKKIVTQTDMNQSQSEDDEKFDTNFKASEVKN